MDTMTTVSEIINKLIKEGYSIDLNLKEFSAECQGNSWRLSRDHFIIDRIFRFEGPSDPADEAIVYAISSTEKDMKGILVNGYGIYSDPQLDEMIQELELPARPKI